MIKKILKNKFFILLTSFIIIVITARFSPVYSLNDRLIALSIGIEKNASEISVILETNQINKNNKNLVVKGTGNNISSCIVDIENNSNKKVSLAQVEIVYLQKKLIEEMRFKFMASEVLKDIPEVAVVVVSDMPSDIIGSKISDSGLNSHDIGTGIRKNKEKVSFLEENIKDLGRDYLSFMGVVTLPYIEVINENKNVVLVNNDITDIDNEHAKDDNKIAILIDKGYCFKGNDSVLLNKDNYLIYQLLNDKASNISGMINFDINEQLETNLWINKIKIDKNFYIKNNKYIAEYVLNVYIYNNESFIMSKLDKTKTNKITNDNKNMVLSSLDLLGVEFIDYIQNSKFDVLHLMDKFNTICEDKLYNEVDFISKLNANIKFNIILQPVKK